MNSVFSEVILADKLSKLNNTQQCIETLSHWCIFHRSKAEQVVETWYKQFNSSDMGQKVPLLYLANDILQNSKRKGNEFVTEFWKVLPKALKDVLEKGDDRGKSVMSRLISIWEERRVFGSQAQSLRDAMLGEELPPPLEIRKKRSRSVKIVKRDSRSIRIKLSIGGAPEKIVSAYHLVLSERANEDDEMSKCKSVVRRVKKMEKDVDSALAKAKDPSRKTLSNELEVEENALKQCVDKLKVVEANRVALVSQLRDALNDQESELENLRTQIQVAQALAEESSNMRKYLEQDDVFDSRPSTISRQPVEKQNQTSHKSASAIAAEVADKLAASTSSQYIMTSVLSTFAAEEAKNAGLAKSSPVTPSFSSPIPQSGSSNPNPLIPLQSTPYQSVVMSQPSVTGHISSSQAQYHHSILNQTPPPQYIQQSSGITGLYDYNSSVPSLGQPGPNHNGPSYMMGPMTPLQMTQPLHVLPQQVQASFPPQPGPRMVYYTHPYPLQ